MFLSKKIAKLQRFKESQKQTQRLTQSPSQDPDKIFEGGTKANRYRFRLIPAHSKYAKSQPVYALHGDWPIIVKDNQLLTELSLFNEYKTFQNVAVMDQYGQKVVQIKPEIRKEKCFNTMTEVMDLFPTIGYPDQQTPWPKTFKHYYQTYDKVMKRQSRKKMKSDTRKKFYSKVDEQTEAKTQELFDSHPSFLMKFRLKSHHSTLVELLFGEKFIQEIGHDTESFVTSIFQEGLPQIMPLDNPNSTFMMRTLIEKYFAVEENGTEIPGLSTTLFMKDGFAKPIQYKVTFLMNYEMNTFGMDVVFSITEKGEPSLQSQEVQMNEVFLQTMEKRKEETQYFLSEFYSSDRVGCPQGILEQDSHESENENEPEDEIRHSESIKEEEDI